MLPSVRVCCRFARHACHGRWICRGIRAGTGTWCAAGGDPTACSARTGIHCGGRPDIHTLIQAQIDAFKKDDFAAAYALAAPSWKALYPSLQVFTAMVRSRFAQLQRPKSIVFGTISQTPQGPVQRIFVAGSDGRAYVANYSLQQQPDRPG